MTELDSDYGFLPCIASGNCGIWADVVRHVPWDESFAFGGCDVEFAWRVQLAGYRLMFEPSAVASMRYRRTVAALATQHFRHGASEPHLFRCFHAAGMPRTSIAKAVLTWCWLITRLPRALYSREMLGNWLRLAAVNCGRVWGSFRWRVIYI